MTRRNWPYAPRYRCREGGGLLKKRRESGITKACLDYLRVLENSKQIAWAQRMNSGKAFTGKRSITLCRPGTADIMIRLNNGHTIHCENKMPGEGLADIQKEFKARMEAIGDTYIVIHSCQELRDFMEASDKKG
jgi:hypothetical protein